MLSYHYLFTVNDVQTFLRSADLAAAEVEGVLLCGRSFERCHAGRLAIFHDADALDVMCLAVAIRDLQIPAVAAKVTVAVCCRVQPTTTHSIIAVVHHICAADGCVGAHESEESEPAANVVAFGLCAIQFGVGERDGLVACALGADEVRGVGLDASALDVDDFTAEELEALYAEEEPDTLAADEPTIEEPDVLDADSQTEEELWGQDEDEGAYRTCRGLFDDCYGRRKEEIMALAFEEDDAYAERMLYGKIYDT